MKNNISMSVANIQITIYRYYKHHVSYYKAWVAKQKILERLFGMNEKSFQILLRMLLDLEESNSSIVID